MTVYSHTLLAQYRNCPAKCRAMYFDKTYPKFKPTAETSKGRNDHNALAKLITGDPNKAQAHEYWPLIEPILAMRDRGAALFVEREFTVNRDWQPCGRWDDDAYITGKPDVALVTKTKAFIPDWKTGNIREDPAELELFACLLKAYFPDLKAIGGMYMWLKELQAGDYYDLSNTYGLQAATDRLISDIEADEEWRPERTPLCFWCELNQCEYWEWGQDWGRRNGRTK
jgi:hypothetical protein